MTLKIRPASPEEIAFAADVNKHLTNGAKVNPFTVFDTETEASTYHLTFQLGSKRTSIQADGPFHYDPVDDVVKRVNEWVAGLSTANRWSTDPKYAD